MTRKDYELIARAIRAARTNTNSFEGLVGIRRVMEELRAELQATNPRFDGRKFIEACEEE